MDSRNQKSFDLDQDSPEIKEQKLGRKSITKREKKQNYI